MVSLTDRPDMTIGVYCGLKTTLQRTEKIPEYHPFLWFSRNLRLVEVRISRITLKECYSICLSYALAIFKQSVCSIVQY